MKKVLVKCPICRVRNEDACAFMTVERVVGDKTYAYCCESQAKKVIHK